jgi:hypothetical protein
MLRASSSEIEGNQNERALERLDLAGDNGNGPFPLGNCEGDCESDSDCESGLKCFQRGGSESIPGCSGDRRSYRGRDFCYRPSDAGDDGDDGDNGGGGGGSFQIKMWWQEGYYWQEENFERKWCFDCRSGCNTNVEIVIRECGGRTRFEFVGSGQVQVKVSGKDLCLELMSNNRDIRLQKCSSTSRQKFTAGLGDFNGKNWELQPAASRGCLTQPHHPRYGEIISKYGCDGARFDTTSLFKKY